MTDLQDRLREALADRYRIERTLGAGGMAPGARFIPGRAAG